MNRRAALVVLTMPLVSCVQPLAPESAVVGVYALTAVDGVPLPVVMGLSPKVEMQDRTVVLDRTGRFTDDIDLRVEVDGRFQPLPRAKAGAYFVDDDGIALVYESGRLVRSSLAGDVLILNDRGVRFRLQR